MPVIVREFNHINRYVLTVRDWRQPVGKSGIAPIAFAFLLPVFIIALVVPIVCILCMRRRRSNPDGTSTKKPRLRREEAMERLRAVTDVSTGSSDVKSSANAETGDTRISACSVSMLGKECTICLAALHAPAPPEPAKLVEESIEKPAIIASPKVTTETKTDPILKLNVCGHEFHADCLVSWFVLRKTSCPICRAEYISSEMMQTQDDEAELAAPPPPPVTQSSHTPISVIVYPTRNWIEYMNRYNAGGRGFDRSALAQRRF